MARLIRTDKEVEGRYEEVWIALHEGGGPPSWAPPEEGAWRD